MAINTKSACNPRGGRSAFTRGVGAIAVLSLIAGLSGCGGASDDASETMHDEDRPTRGDDTWMWVAATETQYDRVIKPLVGMSGTQFVASDHALVRKAQSWIDRLDSTLRTKHPEQMVNVPRPIARVAKDLSVNAFIAPAPVCYATPVKLKPSGATAEKVYFDVSTGAFGAWPAELECLSGSAATGKVRELIDGFNASQQDCQVNLDAAGTMKPNAACQIDDDAKTLAGAKQVVVLQAASFVTVMAGLYTAMTEEAFVAVIAHELGHYYRAHTNTFAPDYDFFYTALKSAQARKPDADSARKPAGEGAVVASRILGAVDMHSTIAGQVIRPDLYFATGSLITRLCAGGACPAKCTAARTYMNSAAYSGAIGQYPFGDAGTAVTTAYREFETKALACLAEVKVAAGSGALAPSGVSWDRFKEQAQAPTWPSWINQLSPRGRQLLAEIGAMTAQRLGTAAPATASLEAAIAGAKTVLDRQDDEAVAMLKRAVDERVGFYTAEEEADDTSVEWIADIGIDPKHGIDAMRRLGRGIQTGLRGYSYGEKECEALIARNWRDAAGNYVFVPVGDFAEPHHSVCYRMFNMDREIAAHALKPAAVSLPPMNGQAWFDLQKQAQLLGAGESGGTGGPALQVHPRIKGNRALNCLYAPDLH